MSYLTNLAIVFRASQLVAHHLHHTVKGVGFLEDHEFLGEVYGAYEQGYDDTIERMLGTGQKVDINTVITAAAAAAKNMLSKYPDVTKWASTVMEIEKHIRAEIDAAMDQCSAGTQNLLAGFADDSEKRTYKASRRAMA
jgi:DNA-binding ferritin-like protein